MKVILTPTDFSENSQKAIDYAIELAKSSEGKIILFHAFHIPVVSTEIPMVMPLDTIEKDCLDSLEEMKKNILLKNPGLTVDCICKCGFAVDEIESFIEDNKVDILVMGMHGAGYLDEKIMGNITTSIIRKIKLPVLVISGDIKFKPLKKIMLACDYLTTKNRSVLEPLKELARFFDSHIYILNVSKQAEKVPVNDDESATGFNDLEQLLNDTEHSFHYAQNEDIVTGINEFVLRQQMDMVVMIPRAHNIFKNIFQEPNSKKMAFHTNVPLLTLHE